MKTLTWLTWALRLILTLRLTWTRRALAPATAFALAPATAFALAPAPAHASSSRPAHASSSRPAPAHLTHLTRLTWLGVAAAAWLTLCVSSPALAQQKTLEELMNEVAQEEAAPDQAQPAASPQGADAGDERPKTLEQLMGEVAQEGDDDQAASGQGASDKAKAAADEDDDLIGQAPEANAPAEKQQGPGALFFLGILGIIVGSILLGAPLYVLIGGVTLYLLFFGGVFTEFRLLASIIEQTRSLSDKEVLLAIPFFVVSGALMTEGDIASRLIRFADVIFGKMPGGLAISTVFACAFFAAVSGSSPVTVIAIGSIMYPALMRDKYPEPFSIGLVTSGGSLGILIPPSIPMIIYAIVDPTGLRDPAGYAITKGGGGDTGVTDLFLAGMGPALLIALALAFYSYHIGLKMRADRPAPTSYIKFFIGAVVLIALSPIVAIAFVSALVVGMTLSIREDEAGRARLKAKLRFDVVELWEAFRDGFWAIFLPVLILGGIYSGLFTPTEASAVAVLYAVVVEFFIHRSLTLSDIPKIFTESVILMGSLFVIIALALGFNMYLDRAKIPEAAVEMILGWDLSIWTFLLIVNILLLIVGFFMDILSAILILVPLLAPIAYGLGIHPLHLAVVFIVNLEIGYLTPPIGLNLFVASTLFKKGIGDVVRAVVPFIAMMMACLLLVTYVPTISLGPVALLKGQSPWITFPKRDAKDAPASPGQASPGQASPGSSKPGDPAQPSTPDSSKPAPKPDGAKTLEELMRESESDEDGDGDSPAPGAGDPAKPKTMDELMRESESE